MCIRIVDHALTAFIQVDGVHQIMSTINVTHIATLRIVTEVLARVSVHVYAHITVEPSIAATLGNNILAVIIRRGGFY